MEKPSSGKKLVFKTQGTDVQKTLQVKNGFCAVPLKKE